MMRHWLLTNTTYGTWLPGDQRGSVTSVRERRPGEPVSESRVEHDQPGEAWESPIPGLRHAAQNQLKGPPILLTAEQAKVVLAQLRETAQHRGWELLAASIMANHFHIVVELQHDPDPKRVLADFKAYASRSLNRQFGRPQSETWWTTRGSKRKLPDAKAVAAAINYVVNKQPHALALFSAENDTTNSGEPRA